MSASNPNLSDRVAGTAILFLLPTEHYSRKHRVRSDELWLHQAGDPLELTIEDFE